MTTPLRLVSATRLSKDDFWKHSLLGKSLRAMPEQLRPEVQVRFDNRDARKVGLSTLYNRAIDHCPSDRNLLLVHDDVYLHDIFLQQRVHDALAHSEVVGLAGSRNSDLQQPSWCLYFDEALERGGWQRQEGVVLAGAVNHFTGGTGHLGDRAPPIDPSVLYGPLHEIVHLLDGLFLAVNATQLRNAGVYFDEQFDFHLYDLDFCRTATRRGLSLSTAAILVSHGSGGGYASPEWRDAARRYLKKWSPSPPETVFP